MPEGLIDRIQRAAGVPDLLEILSERLQPTDWQSLLLEVNARRAAQVTPKRLLEQYQANRFVTPSRADPRRLLELDRLAWQLLPDGYEQLELSPVCPLGTNSAVASVHQHKVITASRGTEVVADSSNVLALECAVRRRRLRQNRQQQNQPILLAASHRLVRAQPFEGKRSWQHFRALTLCAGGRDEGDYGFQTRQLREQIRFYVQLLKRLYEIDVPVRDIRVAISDFSAENMSAVIARQLLEPLSDEFPEVKWHNDPQRTAARGYYDGMCFGVYAAVAEFGELNLADGGCTNWTQQLLSDSKERLVVSGLGTERLCVR